MTPLNSPVVLIGAGEMGGVFARGLLRAGYPVWPLTRHADIDELAAAVPEPAMVLVAVGEKDLHPVLELIPEAWRDRLALLQNELLPRDWQAHGLAQPTVTSVWFEKKPGRDPKVIIPTPVYGPQAETLQQALTMLDIPVKLLASAQQLLHELVLKNLYIVTTNIAGLKVGGNVGELWSQHQELVRAVADDVLDIQQALTGQAFDREALIAGMVEAFDGDREHGCMGRSAPARLQRALAHADEFGLEVKTLRSLAGEAGT
jgi:hypothetical protein